MRPNKQTNIDSIQINETRLVWPWFVIGPIYGFLVETLRAMPLREVAGRMLEKIL
jgi:hypothetical protein